MKQRTAMAAVVAMAGSAVGQDCLIQVRQFDMSIEQIGAGAAEFNLVLDPPVAALEGTLFSLDASEFSLRVDEEGQAQVVATMELIDDGAVIDVFGPAGIMFGDAVASPLSRVVVRPAFLTVPASGATVDEVRLRFEVVPISGAPQVRFTVTGLAGDPAMRLLTWPGLRSVGRSAHTVVEFPGELPIILPGPGVSDWRELVLPEPAPLASASELLFRQFEGGVAGGPASTLLEARLVLDDGSELVFDDVRSPSLGAPLPAADGIANLDCAMTIDPAQRLALADRSVAKVMYRFHLNGPVGSSARIRPFGGTAAGGTLELIVGRCAWDCYADASGDGTLDFFDFLVFQNEFAAGHPAADCDASGALDLFDFLCFQNAFGAGCS
ncbi:MAG: GC-type dockerin domain-anchored protein [Phycisphaerales bacterium JB039]